MVSSFQDSRRITLAQVQSEKLLNSNGMHQLLYFQNAKFDAAPAAQEIFVNGVQNSRLYLPVSSIVAGTARFAFWNVTDNTAATAGFRNVDFSVTRGTSGTGAVTFTPTNISGTDGNPVTVRSGGAGALGLGLVLAVDDVNKALIVNYTGAANKSYLVRGRIDFIATGFEANEYSNFFTATT